MSADPARWPQPLRELRYALAEGDAVASPAGLRDRVVASATAGRPPGEPSEIPPDITSVEVFGRTVDSLAGLLAGLTAAEWARPALRHHDVQGVIGHLVGVEADFQRRLAGEPAQPLDADHIASTEAAASAQAGRPPEDTRAEWVAATAATAERLARTDRAAFDAPVALYGVTLSLERWLLVRAFEMWTHEEDIRRAIGRPLLAPEPERLSPMTRLAVTLLPAGLSRADLSHPGCMARLVLTGGGGGTWSVPLGPDATPPADVRVVMDAADFCRVIADRYDPARVGVLIVGRQSLADDLFAAAAALAFD